MKKTIFHLFILIGVLCTSHLFGMQREWRDLLLSDFFNKDIVHTRTCASRGSKEFKRIYQFNGTMSKGYYTQFVCIAKDNLKKKGVRNVYIIKMISGEYADKYFGVRALHGSEKVLLVKDYDGEYEKKAKQVEAQLNEAEMSGE